MTTSEQSHYIVQAIIDGLTDVAFVKDLEGRYLLVNQAAATWVGTSPKAMIGRVDSDFFPAEVANSIRAADQSVIEADTLVAYEEELVQGDQVRSLLTQKFPWRDNQGQPQGIVGICQDVTERKQAIQALYRSEHKLRRVIDSVDTFIGVVSTEGVLLEINQKALDAANLRAQDVIGLPLVDTYWWAHSTDVQARLADAIKQAKQGSTIYYDERVRIAADQFITIDFCLVPVFKDETDSPSGTQPNARQVDYLVASANDISHRIKNVTALRQSEKLNQAILSALPDLIARMRVDGTYLDIKPGNFPLLYPIETAVGRNIGELLPEEIARRRLGMAARALGTGEMQRHEYSTQTDGKTYWRETRIVPLGEDEVLMSVRDFTKLHQTKAALGEALQKEQSARQEAEQANQMKDEFLTVLSHELRTPLNPISGWADLLLQGKLNEERILKAAATIRRNAESLTQLIDDLLEVARMLQGNIKLEGKAVCLEPVVLRAIETVQIAAQVKSLNIDTSLDKTLLVKGDETKLQQVVWNLLTNAVKFTPDGGQISVRLGAIGQKAQLEISDTGVGIGSDFLPYVFDRFRQSDGSITRQFGGLGLGLAIVRQLTELHGGTVSVQSAGENQGTTFTIQLPLLTESDSEMGLEAGSKTDADADGDHTNHRTQSCTENCLENCLENCNILLVDDDVDARKILSLLLQVQGVIVTEVSSAKDCLAQLDRAVPDVLICDVGMPTLDGYGLIHLIRRRPAERGGHVKSIAMTAYAKENSERSVLAAGFQAYLVKPIEIDQLIDKISSLTRA